MKIQIKFDGIEPVLMTTTVKGRSTTYKERGLFYPFRRIGRKYSQWSEKRLFKKAGLKPEICDSCGENIAHFVIDSPNYGERNTWFVCKTCADFCDWKMTRRPLPYTK